MTKITAVVTELLAALARPAGAQTDLQPIPVLRDAPKRDLLTRR